MMKKLIAGVALAGLLGPMAAAQAADAWPGKPIKFVVPFPPGGSADGLARIVADGLSKRLGTPVVPENRPGANTIIAMDHVAAQPADGYTLLLCTPALPINPSLYKVNYDPEKSFTYLSLLASVPLILVTHPDVPASTAKDMVQLAKAKPGELTYSSYGMGSASHLAGELVTNMTGARMLHVPFKGSAQAVTEVIAGRVSMSFTTIPMAVPHIKAGRVKAIGVTSNERVDVVKEYPPLAETGLPGFEVVSWNGLCGPAGMSRDIVERIHKAVVETFNAPESRARLVAGGYLVVGSRPEEFKAFVAAEVRKWSALIREASIKVE